MDAHLGFQEIFTFFIPIVEETPNFAYSLLMFFMYLCYGVYINTYLIFHEFVVICIYTIYSMVLPFIVYIIYKLYFLWMTP